jgi:Flp pilus assembly pilin Flp
MNALRNLWNSEQGQDLTEYVLLLAAVALCTAALVTGPMASVSQIWVSGNSEMSTAASVAGS